MIANRNFEHCEPLTWMGRMPVYLSTALAIGQAVGMIITALASMAGAVWFFDLFRFSTERAVGDFYVWQIVSYAFVTPPDIWAAIQIVLLAIFGREVEKSIGRVSFAWLYGLLVVAAPIFLAVLSFFDVPSTLDGAGLAQFAVFIAFVLLYPSAEVFFGIQAKWLGLAILGIYTLQDLALHQWRHVTLLWLECAVAALWLAREGAGALRLPSFPQYWRQRSSRRALKVVKEEPVQKNGEAVYDSIDPILEKIARRGIGSLTRAEREQLEKARVALLEKERH